MTMTLFRNSVKIPEFGSWSRSPPKSSGLLLVRRSTPQKIGQEFVNNFLSCQQNSQNAPILSCRG